VCIGTGMHVRKLSKGRQARMHGHGQGVEIGGHMAVTSVVQRLMKKQVRHVVVGHCADLVAHL